MPFTLFWAWHFSCNSCFNFDWNVRKYYSYFKQKYSASFLELPLTLESDWRLISLYKITPESNLKVTRIKEIITKWRSSKLFKEKSVPRGHGVRHNTSSYKGVRVMVACTTSITFCTFQVKGAGLKLIARRKTCARPGRSVSPSMRLPRFDICSPEKRKKPFVLQVRVMGFVHCLRSLHDKSSSYQSIY